MKHQVNIYYMSCPKTMCSGETFHSYQKKLADEMLNHGLKEMFGVDGKGVKREKGVFGKPYLKEMQQYHFNISNTDGMVACAVSDVEVGVDTERIRERKIRTGVIKKCCTEEEAAYIHAAESTVEQTSRFFQIWTLKESYIKMTGEGLRMPLTEVSFQISSKGEVICSRSGRFLQKKIGEYWISLGIEEEAQVRWCSLEQIRADSPKGSASKL